MASSGTAGPSMHERHGLSQESVVAWCASHMARPSLIDLPACQFLAAALSAPPVSAYLNLSSLPRRLHILPLIRHALPPLSRELRIFTPPFCTDWGSHPSDPLNIRQPCTAAGGDERRSRGGVRGGIRVSEQRRKTRREVAESQERAQDQRLEHARRLLTEHSLCARVQVRLRLWLSRCLQPR